MTQHELPARVRLRHVRDDDLAWLAEARLDRNLVGEHNWAPGADADELVASWRAEMAVDGLAGDRQGTLIVELDDGTRLGDVSWRPERWGPSVESICPAIGISLRPEHRGRGVGTAAQVLLVEYLVRRGAHRVQSDTATDNPAEQRALEKAGFRREGVVRDAEWRGGIHHDHVLYGIVRGEWLLDDERLSRLPDR